MNEELKILNLLETLASREFEDLDKLIQEADYLYRINFLQVEE